MGLKDLFKPRWQHTNAQVRVRALSKIRDDSLLKQISLNDSSKEVRLSALGRLQEGWRFSEYGKKSKWRKEYQKFLQNIVSNDSNEEMRCSAIIKIIELIDDNEDKSKYAGKADQNFLMGVVKKDKSASVRKNAIDKIKDLSFLLEIVQNDNDSEVRESAVNKILNAGNKKILREIAENGKYKDVRKNVIANGIDDHLLLIKIANNDPSKEVRITALNSIKDLNIIKGLAKTSTYEDVRIVAHFVMSEQEKLIKSAYTCKHEGELWNIINGIIDFDVIDKITFQTELSSILELANAKLKTYVHTLNDQDQLMSIVKNSQNEVFRNAAISKIKNEELRKSFSASLLNEVVDKFETERNFTRRMYLTHVIVDRADLDSIILLGKAMLFEAEIYKECGEYCRERLVQKYQNLVGKKFGRKPYKNIYGAKCDDAGLLAALKHFEAEYVKKTIISDSNNTEVLNKTKVGNISWKNYQNEQWSFSFIYPEDWIILSSDTTSGSWEIPISVGNKEGTGGPADFIVAVKKTEVLKLYGDNPNIEITDYHDNGTISKYKKPSTPSEYLELMKNENNIKKHNIISEEEKSIAGYPSIEYTFYEPQSNKNVTSRIITIFGKGITFQFKCQTPSQEFQKFNSIFTEIINTFNLRDSV